METVGNGPPGNTKLADRSEKKRPVPSKRWCFTLNNWVESDLETLELMFKDAECEYIIGKEIGESGTPHLQGYIRAPTKIRALEKFKTKNVHWESCRGSHEENIRYCTKDGNYVGNVFVPRRPNLLSEEQLFPWQRAVLDIVLTVPDDRTIHWYWEPEGMAGKTTFCKYLSAKHRAIPLEGKKNDILYCAAMYETDVYVWDLERSMQEYISYGALEKIKNGYFMCSKYESKPIVRACPHVFVFANFPPDLSALSRDRWKVVKIGQAELAR